MVDDQEDSVFRRTRSHTVKIAPLGAIAPERTHGVRALSVVGAASVGRTSTPSAAGPAGWSTMSSLALADAPVAMFVPRLDELTALRALADTSASASVVTDRSGRVAFATRRAGELAGVGADDLVGTLVVTLVADADRSMLTRRIDDALPSCVAVRLRHASGVVHAVDATIEPIPAGLSITFAPQASAERHPGLDPVTGLADRSSFLTSMASLRAEARRRGHLVGVVVVDLHRFDTVNRALGHEAGNELLRRAAERLRAADGHACEIVARSHGDTFLVATGPHADAPAMEAAADRIRTALRGVVDVLGTPILLSAAVGVAEVDTADVSAAVQRAAIACGRARRSPATVAVATSADSSTPWALSLEAALRTAIDADEIEVHLQPIVHVASGEVAAVEALARWRHEGVSVPPVVFVRIAEEIGMIHELDRLVLRKAAALAASWQDTHPSIGVHVNCSPTGLCGVTDFAAFVADSCTGAGLDPSMLTIELTETTDLLDLPTGPTGLQAIVDLGVRLALDDLGAGSSSLKALRRLPITQLKLDRSLIGPLGQSAQDDAIASAIVSLAHALNVEVVAEGVDTVAKLGMVARTGCELAQGHLIAPAMPIDELRSWLADPARVAAARS
jgi:diguanylate cyclase (GGDEF)-like protein/PAS domain S-box-containing protein